VLQVLDEKLFPCVYAVHYILGHGEGQLPAIWVDEVFPYVRFEEWLQSHSFNDIVSYLTLNTGLDIPREFAKLLDKLGVGYLGVGND
jgi:hypothetical protein